MPRKPAQGMRAYFDSRDPKIEPIESAGPQPDRIVELPLAALWLDDQPRRIVPDTVLERLMAEDRAQPEALLAELKHVAQTHPYYRDVLESLQALARTIAADGVLEPLLVVMAQGRHVLRDGHRRSLASLLAGKETVPSRIIEEPSALQAACRQLVVNIQREDLTALEKGRWLLRLARLVEEQLRAEQGLEGGSAVVDALVGGQAEESGTEATGERRLGREVRERVCALTGLGRAHYYNLLGLNRLTPEAQEVGLGLTEGQLRPVTGLPSTDQAEIMRFIASRGLTSKEATTLVQVARSGDRDAIERLKARLAREDAGRSRTAASWQPLLNALPQDLWARCSSLRAELAALPEDRRGVRLRALASQRQLAREFVRELEELLTLYGVRDESAPELESTRVD